MIKKCLCSAFVVILIGFNTLIVASEQLKDANLMEGEIKHVVILMLENRSFDNVLGWLYNQKDVPSQFIPDRTDSPFLGLSEETLGQYTNNLKKSSGEILFSCAPIKGLPSVNQTNLLNSPKFDPFEAFPNVTHQIYGFEGGLQPTMTGFLQDYASIWDEEDWLDQKQGICAVMETYTDQELPVLHGLARQYAVSDLWFSSVPTQTNPNRAFSICGTSGGEIVNGSFGKNVFQADTIWNRLYEESPSTTWKIFWQSDMLPILFPGPFNGTNSFASLSRIPNLEDHFQRVDSFHELARNGQLPDISFVEPQWTISTNFSPTEEEIVKYAFRDQEFILGMQGNDLHPPGDVRTGENLLANIYTSLIANPEAWKETLLIVTFDEHGGLFDHVPPPSAIPPDNYFQNGFEFDRYGVRVATLFISPKINKGVVIRSDDPSIPFDHTSIISTLLKWKNIDKSKWNMGKRVDAAPTFDGVITLSDPRTDSIIADKTISLKETNEGVVHMGDPFCLRDEKGNYLTLGKFERAAYVGSKGNKGTLEFVGGSGKITHGSFTLIKSNNPSYGEENMMETSLGSCDCVFNKNKHASSQWWTIKSMDHPCIGSEIYYGDRVYIENHLYFDLIQYVPCRLAKDDGFFYTTAITKAVTDPESQGHYWIIEKP